MAARRWRPADDDTGTDLNVHSRVAPWFVIAIQDTWWPDDDARDKLQFGCAMADIGPSQRVAIDELDGRALWDCVTTLWDHNRDILTHAYMFDEYGPWGLTRSMTDRDIDPPLFTSSPQQIDTWLVRLPMFAKLYARLTHSTMRWPADWWADYLARLHAAHPNPANRIGMYIRSIDHHDALGNWAAVAQLLNGFTRYDTGTHSDLVSSLIANGTSPQDAVAVSAALS